MEETNGTQATENTEAATATDESGQVPPTSEALINDLKSLVERMTCEGRDQMFWRDELQALIVQHG